MDDKKKKVAKEFGLPNPLILESRMHVFAGLRNILANQAFNSFSAFPEDALVRIKPSV